MTDDLICDQYRLGNAFGKGTHGLVRKAQDIQKDDPLGWRLAAKLVKLEDSTDFFDFEAEVSSMQTVQGHRNIIQLHAAEVCGTDTSYGVIVMEKGEMDLLDYMEDQGRLCVPQVQEIFFEVCAAVAHCHHLKIAHRDIKPENIVMCGDTPKLVDFGAAHDFYDPRDRYCEDVVGTRVYTAPEIQKVTAEGYDCVKGDIWAMGILLHVLLTGCWPYRKGSLNAEPELYIVEGNFAGTPRALSLLKSLLAANPEDRPSMAEVLIDPFFLPDDFDLNNKRRSISMSSKTPIKRRKKPIRRASAATTIEEEPLTVEAPKKLSVVTRIRKELRVTVLASRLSGFRGRRAREERASSKGHRN